MNKFRAVLWLEQPCFVFDRTKSLPALGRTFKMATFKESENFREFYQAVGSLYPEEDLVYRTLRGKVRKQFILKHLNSFSGLLLDIGCNRGAYISDYKNGAAIGLDISFPVLNRARQRLGNILLQGDAQNPALKSEKIDIVLCSEVLEHVPDPEKVIAEAYRVLKTGGILFLTTPNYSGEKPTWVKIGEMSEYGVAGVKDEYYFHTAFKPAELKDMAAKAGFAKIQVGTFEKEVKYATRIPVLFFHAVRLVNKLFRSPEIDKINKVIMERASLLIYNISVFLRLNNFFVNLMGEGVRSYLIAKK
jgi:SAM-dependent methyltransferase